jgi:hypothetical protein
MMQTVAKPSVRHQLLESTDEALLPVYRDTGNIDAFETPVRALARTAHATPAD